MKYAAAFVLLVTIAGTPVTTLACVGRCIPDATPVSASCHHHGSRAGANINGGDDTCAPLLATAPFLKEDIQPIRTAMAVSAPYALSGATGEAPLASVHDVAFALRHRATSSLVLRL